MQTRSPSPPRLQETSMTQWLGYFALTQGQLSCREATEAAWHRDLGLKGEGVRDRVLPFLKPGGQEGSKHQDGRGSLQWQPVTASRWHRLCHFWLSSLPVFSVSLYCTQQQGGIDHKEILKVYSLKKGRALPVSLILNLFFLKNTLKDYHILIEEGTDGPEMTF